MKPSKLIVYVLVLAALVGYVYFIEIKGKQKEEAAKAKENKLVDLEKEKIDLVTLEGKDLKTITIRKTAGIWVLTEPVKTRADKSSIKTLLATLDKASLEKLISEKNDDWAEYGLKDPEFKVIVKAGDKETSLLFGNKNPSGSSYYLRVADNPRLVLVEDTLRNALKKDPIHYRDKTVIALAPEDINELVITQDEDKKTLKKTKEGRWEVTNGSQYRAKSNTVKKILRDLTNLEAEDIIDNPDKSKTEYGFQDPSKTILLKGTKPDHRIIVGNPVQTDEENSPFKSLYVKVGGRSPIYVAQERSFKDLEFTRSALEDKSLLSLEPKNINSIDISMEEKDWKLAKDNKDKWLLKAPEEKKLDNWPVNNLIWTFTDLNWLEEMDDETLDLKEGDLKNPNLVASFSTEDSKELIKLKAFWESAEAKGNTPVKETASQENEKVSSDEKEEPDPENEKSATPEEVYVTVKPHYKGDVIFKVDPEFINRLRINLSQLVEKPGADE